jgi:hypothetical protein
MSPVIRMEYYYSVCINGLLMSKAPLNKKKYFSYLSDLDEKTGRAAQKNLGGGGGVVRGEEKEEEKAAGIFQTLAVFKGQRRKKEGRGERGKEST